jgi:hypothetical protein
MKQNIRTQTSQYKLVQYHNTVCTKYIMVPRQKYVKYCHFGKEYPELTPYWRGLRAMPWNSMPCWQGVSWAGWAYAFLTRSQGNKMEIYAILARSILSLRLFGEGSGQEPSLSFCFVKYLSVPLLTQCPLCSRVGAFCCWRSRCGFWACCHRLWMPAGNTESFILVATCLKWNIYTAICDSVSSCLQHRTASCTCGLQPCMSRA